MTMRFRSFAFVSVAAILLAAPVPALAQRDEAMEPPAGKQEPRGGRDRTETLDFLFGALKAAPDEASAKAIEQKIWARWLITKSDTANLLMTRVKAAVDSKDLDLALRLLDAIIEIKPDYVEAWNRRATIYYQKKDYSRSVADIRQVLAREPRHFGAIAGLALIMQDIGEDKRALEMYRKALEIYPRLPRIPDTVKTLSEKVEGRDI
jgi:tetratricopeptide (TPR) repeat protein